MNDDLAENCEEKGMSYILFGYSRIENLGLPPRDIKLFELLELCKLD